MSARMKRRSFIAMLGGAVAGWSFNAHAQQASLPVIGFLNSTSLGATEDILREFRQGLKDMGNLEGENVAIDYRFADNQIDRLPELAAELVRRRVGVIVTSAPPAALAAKAATSTIPILFAIGGDPVRLGLVASLGRPGGNLTGTNFFIFELGAKRLEILRELVPTAARLAVLVNPDNVAITESNLRDVELAARAMGLKIDVAEANTGPELDAAFVTFMRGRPDGLYVSSGPFFSARRVQLALLAARHAIPAIYAGREHAEAGGLISYGASRAQAYRQIGLYAGRILKGASPAELPVVQSTKFELVVNLQPARILGLTVPPTLLARADEVIE